MLRTLASTAGLFIFGIASAAGAAAQDCVFTPFPEPRIERQPDGTEVSIYLRATAESRWHEDEQGFAVLLTEKGWVYARPAAEGSLEPTEHLLGSVDPRALGLVPNAAPARTAEVPTKTPKGAVPQEQPSGGAFGLGSGSVDNLVLLLRFSNHGPGGQNRTLPSAANVGVIMNAVGGDPILAPTGSVRDHYLESSYGQFTIDSTVVGWLNLPNTETYYADGNSGLTSRIWEAITSGLAAADPSVDFSDFDANGDLWIDAITFLHSGYGAEWGGTDQYGTNYVNRIWSHKWSIPTWTSAEGVRVSEYNISPGLWSTSGSAPGRIGVVCHELGHFFGLPDLYDTDGTSQGIGNWCLMAGGSWGFNSSQQYPSHMSAWAKIKIGWVSPQLLLPGNATAPRVELNPTIFRIDSGYPPGEYLLIENRQPVGFDSVIPQGGLAIWHIDEGKGAFSQNDTNNDEGYPGQSGWPTNGNHYRNALLQADGGFDMEHDLDRGDAGDVYRSGGVSSITSATTPNTNAYQNGTILTNGNAITGIGASGTNMPFTYSSASSPTNTTGSAPIAAVGSPYSLNLTSSGGTNPKTWSEYRASPSYTLSDLGTGAFTLGGVAQNWRADEGVWPLTLPFAFPCWERSYTTVYVSSNGFVDLAPVGFEWENSFPLLRASLRIAPLWDDLVTDQTGGNIFVDTTVPGRVRIRWLAAPYGTTAPANFALSLFSDGRIQFEYGSGNTLLTPTVGISRGEGGQCIVAASHDGHTTLTNASKLQFALNGSLVPPGLALAPNGVLSGTPTTVGSWQPIFRVTDALHRYDQDPKTITVEPDCNSNGIPDSQDLAGADCNSNQVPDDCETDSDSDGTIDACDGCPNDPNKIAPGICGCGIADVDTDTDGTADCLDGCPTDPNKIAPGICGCGVADVDTDADGTADCNDGCPSDPNKIAPGACGCGVPDTDSNGNGIADCNEVCPTISGQPTNQVACTGSNAAFSVTASGTSPLVYQWRFNGIDLSGANSASLTIVDVATGDAGNYDVVIGNGCGSITSSIATLTVHVGPSIAEQPSDQWIPEGCPVSFSVVATGAAPLQYAWRKDGSPLTDGGNISGATTSTLTIDPASLADEGIYDVAVSNMCPSILSAGATLTVGPSQLAQTAKLVASDTACQDGFGLSVAADEHVAVVGAFREHGVSLGTGSAYIYERVDGEWLEAAKLKEPGQSVPAWGNELFFGRSAAVQGNRLLIGAPGDCMETRPVCPGAAYMYEKVDGAWLRVARLVPTGSVNDDQFGWSVAMDGERALIGSFHAEQVIVYERVEATWAETAALQSTTAGPDDRFGSSCAIEGTTVVCGAPLNNDLGTHAGSAYVFELVDGAWTEVATLYPSFAPGDVNFGWDVAIADNRIFVGHPSHTSNESVYVYERIGGTWTETARLQPDLPLTVGRGFGRSLAAEEESLLIGAPNDALPGSVNAGAVYLFRFHDGIWTQAAKLTADDEHSAKVFGHDVALQGSKAFVGAHGDNAADPSNPACQSGAAYLFGANLTHCPTEPLVR